MSTPSPASPYAVRVQGVSKLYFLQTIKPFLVNDLVRRLLRQRRKGEDFWALQDVSVDIRPGESVAFLGRNGAGKSTLLGLISGALSPTRGSVEVNGRLGALLELGAGFHPDLTGRENIYLNASLLGLSREQIEARMEAILDFAELGKFIDVPLRSYSSGMHVRLGFSVAVHVDPEILIMDEALAVGDIAFQYKCGQRILELKAQGKTLLLVTHATGMISSFCSRTVWLEKGQVRMDGPTEEVVSAYVKAS